MRRAKKKELPLRVAIVGAGKVGTVLGKVLAEDGSRITAVISRSRASARSAAAYLRCRTYADALTAIPPDTDVVLIATPHDTIAGVAGTLARLEGLEFPRMSACHASGMLSRAVLAPLEERGCTVFSFHPLQTFPRNFSVRRILPRARGIWYGVDGSPAGLRASRRLARALSGRVIEIPPGSRELYHAACVVASNHFTVLLSAVKEMFGTATGDDRAALRPFGPILEATILNVLATSPGAALSGPVARGGVATVARHLEAVQKACPGLLPYFTRMTLETARLAADAGTLAPERREAIDNLVQSFMQDPPLPGTRT